MAEKKLTEQEVIERDWKTFSSTLAYQRLIEYIEMQKNMHNIMATGPMDIYTLHEDGSSSFQFEPEKYAYLLQRSAGCDIVKLYVEGYVNKPSVVNK